MVLEFADGEIVEALCYQLRRRGATLRLGETVTGVRRDDRGHVIALLDSGKTAHGDVLLSAVGRQANTASLDLAAAGLAADARGRLRVDARFQTEVRHISAAGDDAKKARAEFSRALGAYIDLVALERASGSGARQAMEVAATVGDSWVFRRLAEELARSRWSGVAPWEALHTLGTELGLPELDDLADIMRLSGEEGAQIYANLRARSAGMRSAMLHHELGQANAINERLSIPMSLLGAIFLAMLVAPALLRLVFPGAAPSP